jgi:hypothetical protein
MAKTYDPKCWDLASHFMADQPRATDEDREALAVEIQMSVEEFFATRFDVCPACGACPGFIGAECDEECDHAKAQSQ